MTCQEMVYSNEYADYIIDQRSKTGREFLKDAGCSQEINETYAVIHVKREDFREEIGQFLTFQNLPRIFGLLDTGFLEEAGVLKVQRDPRLDLLGADVILGVIDTGIDYTHPSFIKEDGTSRIGILWDQSIPANNTIKEIGYGTVYRQEDLNRALEVADPLSVVPSMDEDGHGTLLAGIAAGNLMENEEIQGVAPLCELAVVKLKQAKEYLKRFWLIPSNVQAFQETDIFLAFRFLLEYSYEVNKPLVILLGCGTNSGNHGNSDYLKNYMNNISTFSGKCIVMAAGNEGNLGHHFRGNGLYNREYEDVEFQIEEGEQGFTMEFWAEAPDRYTVGFIAPGGETVSKIPVSSLREGIEVEFLLEQAKILVFYEPVERTSGDFLIWMRFESPSSGIWRIRVYRENVLNGRYDMWLPMEKFIKPDTKFLNPDPDTTICEPGNGENPITVTAYDSLNGSLYYQASRGFNREEGIKPDFAAPGVEITGPGKRGRYVKGTGTSMAAAVAAGCAVLLFSFREYYTGLQIKNLLIKGTGRKQLLYPNREWGYGEMNVYESVISLTNR